MTNRKTKPPIYLDRLLTELDDIHSGYAFQHHQGDRSVARLSPYIAGRHLGTVASRVVR